MLLEEIRRRAAAATDADVRRGAERREARAAATAAALQWCTALLRLAPIMAERCRLPMSKSVLQPPWHQRLKLHKD